MLDKLH